MAQDAPADFRTSKNDRIATEPFDWYGTPGLYLMLEHRDSRDALSLILSKEDVQKLHAVLTNWLDSNK